MEEADPQFQLLPLTPFRKASSVLAKLLKARDKRMHLGAKSNRLVTLARGKHTPRVPQRAELRGVDSQLSAAKTPPYSGIDNIKKGV